MDQVPAAAMTHMFLSMYGMPVVCVARRLQVPPPTNIFTHFVHAQKEDKSNQTLTARLATSLLRQ